MNNTAYKHKRIGGRAGKMRLAHHIVWEAAHGQIPENYQVHHIDHNKKNNDLENLLLLSTSDHQKTHSPHFGKLNGEWVRICKYCREIGKPVKRPICDDCRARMGRIERRTNEE